MKKQSIFIILALLLCFSIFAEKMQKQKSNYKIFNDGRIEERTFKVHFLKNGKDITDKSAVSFAICLYKNSPDSASIILRNGMRFTCWSHAISNKIPPIFYDSVWNLLPKGEYKIYLKNLSADENNLSKEGPLSYYIYKYYAGIAIKKD